MRALPMYWWRDWEDDPKRTRDNFGDALGPALIEAIADRQPVLSRKPPRLFSVGSIIRRSLPGDTIWGSGVQDLNTPDGWTPDGITFLAVRGPISRQYVKDRGGTCPEIYGDPASLLPRIYPIVPAPKHEWAAMPHLGDTLGRVFAREENLPSIDPSWPWRRVVESISSCACLLSSSLHGVIVAEAYGVPAIWTAFTKCPEKFHDYYLSTGRIPPQAVPWHAAIGLQPPPLSTNSADPRLVEVLLEWVGAQGNKQ